MASFGNGNEGFIRHRTPPPQEIDTDIEDQPTIETRSSDELKFERAKMDLVRAAWKGDWDKADSIIKEHQSIVGEYINSRKDTAFHIATGAKQTLFVKNLVKKMNQLERRDLQIQDDFGNTALCIAAGTGNLKGTKIFVEIDKDLLNIRNKFGEAPLNLAIAYRHRDIVDYLFPITEFKTWNIANQMELLLSAIFSDYLDIAMEMVEKNTILATERGRDGTTALHLLARNPSVRGTFSFFKGLFYSSKTGNDLAETLWKQVELKFKTEDGLLEFIRYPTNLLHEAARVGNVKLLRLMLSSYPDLIREGDANGNSIFHVALENRQEDVFNLIHEIGGLKHSFANTVDEDRNNYMLHLAAQIASDEHLNKVSGDALKMQREVMWFKVVERMVIPKHLEKRNSGNQKRPIDIFRNTHQKLRRAGEKWMKDTTHNCMLVSTLIATVTFAAMFTIPGGNDQNRGIPIRRRERVFSMFVISDVLALISSSTSMFIFLSSLTSRYAEEDFLRSLPIKLLMGLTTMFISILSMVLAFGAAFFMLYDKSATWAPWTALVIVFIPATCFCILQLRLWVDVLHSTFWFKCQFGKRAQFRIIK